MLVALPGLARASDDEATFLAPFVSVSFLESVRQRIEEAQVLEELVNGVYLDEKEGLLWRRRDNAKDIDWQRAGQYCDDLEFAGFSDWRLPTITELEDLMEPMSDNMYSVPREISLTACCMWSSTLKDEVSAWNFNYRYSKTFSGSRTHTYDLRALCVRPWSEEDGPLPEAPLPAPDE